MHKNKTLIGKTIILTGANRGIGFEMSKYFLQKGCRLILIGRSKKKNFEAKQKLLLLNNINKKNLYFEQLDVSNEKQVDKFFLEIIPKFRKIDVLINNAGIYGPKGKFDEINWLELKKTLNINLLGSIYFIKKILPYFKKKNAGKIIQFSGGGATSPFPFFSPYSMSKTALVRFVENLSIELKNYNISINAIAPGPVNTRMLDEVLNSDPSTVGEDFYKKSLLQKKNGGTDIKKIIDLVEFLIVQKDSEISGRLISAVWDNWNIFKKKKNILKKSDFGTLRRISGRERKLKFFDK